jgi:hypothetical protein
MTITTILLSGAAVLALGIGATYLAPRDVEVRRSIILDSPPAEVLALAASTEGYQTFNPYRSANADLVITPFGPESGVGSGFAFQSAGGNGTQTVIEVTADHVRYAIDLGPQGKPVQTIAARPVPGGTEVTWTMEADMGMNPVGRVFGLFMDRMIGKTFDTGLANLAAATA